MKCKKCQSTASMELKRHNSAFCRDHYLEFFDTQVGRAIKKQKMFTHDDKILVGVSGGKDSLSLWDYLLRNGYDVTGLHIHLGIGDYSSHSFLATKEFSETRNANLITIDLEESYGMSIPLLSQTIRRVPCSGCGLSKRYILNKEAYERDFSTVAMGHNLDDEAATLLGNILHWEISSLARQSPSLPSKGNNLISRVKPLYTMTEREVAANAILRGISYIEEDCPNSKGAQSLIYKEAIDSIELNSPGTKHSLVSGFLDRVRPIMEASQDEFRLNDCTICGQPTTSETCAFCRMWDNAHHKTSSNKN
ncbi:MAG: ATP-binding protein [Chloroflexota bacterium]|nr:ATP-binding protein [Chloroflexota bacterium]